MPKIIRSRYEQGLAAYRAGHNLLHIHEIGEEIEKQSRRRWEEIGSKARTDDPAARDSIDAQREAFDSSEHGHDAFASIISGFADGLIEDIRQVTSSPAITRRGQKA